MLPRRVVITGMGAVSPFGLGVSTLMENLKDGNSAVVSLKKEWENDIPDLNCWVGAPLKKPLPAKNIHRKYRRTMGASSIMAVLAAKEALENSRIPDEIMENGKTGVSFSSTTGSVDSYTQFYKAYFKGNAFKEMSAGSFFQVMSHTCAANIAHTMSIKGRVISPDSACASSAQAIGLGYETIKHGIQNAMVCGGADELRAIVCGSFDLLNATSYRFNDNPSSTPRPFDKDRDGTVCGEGAGCMLLESEETALARGATIYGEIIGFSTSSDGTHLAQPHSHSITQCINDALIDAKIKSNQIDYVNAHATATILGDIAEATAIREVFGHKVPVSSLKGHIAHTLGASGVLELVACVKMVEEEELIPTLNFETPGEGCEGLYHLKKREKRKVNTIMKNSFAFGGINAVLIIRRYESTNG